MELNVSSGRPTMLSSAYQCQRAVRVTLKVILPMCMALGVVLGIFIAMETSSPDLVPVALVSHTLTKYNMSGLRHPAGLRHEILNKFHSSFPPTSPGQAVVTLNETHGLSWPVLTDYGQSILATNLSDFKVFIYPLPKSFNKNLADCAVRNARSSMCFDITNKGMGALVHSDFVHGYSIYNTHQFSLEVLLHQKLVQSRFLTWDPSEADIFYVPYYVAMRCFCPAQEGEAMNKEFWNVMLQNFTYLHQGKPHFMALGKVEQEVSSKHCPFLQSSNSHLLKYLLIEQTHWTRTRKFFKRWHKEDEVLVVPYPSYIHFDRPQAVIESDNQHDIQTFHHNKVNRHSFHGNRTILALMVGSLKGSLLRKTLAVQLNASSVGHFYHIQPNECWISIHNSARRISKLMHRSTFCLQPPGDTPTRKSFFDALLCGCIPVVFMSGVIYPFSDVFNYSTLSVYVSGHDVTERGVNVISTLAAIPQQTVRTMQDTLSRVAQHFQYGTYRQDDDAFTLAMKKLAHIFKLNKFIDPALNISKKERMDPPYR